MVSKVFDAFAIIPEGLVIPGRQRTSGVGDLRASSQTTCAQETSIDSEVSVELDEMTSGMTGVLNMGIACTRSICTRCCWVVRYQREPGGRAVSDTKGTSADLELECVSQEMDVGL